MTNLKDTKIAKKLPALIVILTVLTAMTSGIVAYQVAANNAISAAEEKLTALQISRRDSLAQYLDSIDQDLSSLSFSDYVKSAMQDFDSAWDELLTDQEQLLQKLYITDNPHPTGSKEELDFASDGSVYSEVHAQYHPWFRHFLRERGYYDIFLFNTSGDLVYTVYKELDYATNLNTGEWKNTGLGNAFRAALNSSDPTQQHFFDFKPYEPSFGAPASFISQPLVDEFGNTLGVLVFQMPIGRINGIMQATAGMGESGETYIVGDDFLMRSDSRFSEESTMLNTRVEGDTVSKALSGQQGVEVVTDYRGIPVFSAYGPMEFKGTNWAILAEIDESEVFQPIVAMRNKMILLLLLVLACSVAFALLIARSISEPLIALRESMSKLAGGDLNAPIPHRDREDEIGVMAKTMSVFKANALRAEELEKEKRASSLQSKAQKRADMEDLASQLEARVGAIVGDVRSAALSLQDTAAELSNIADQSNSQVRTLQNESETVTGSVSTVATAAEKLTASFSEITNFVNNSRRIAESAVAKATSTNQVVSELVDSANNIDEILNLISDVAEQINLLALNATIEAARAGDAGKGFAVVAAQVKTLSSQAANATAQISDHISRTQGSTEAAAKALQEIGTIIGEMNSISSQISDSISAQSSSTGDISNSIHQTANSTRKVNESVVSVSTAAERTELAATSMQSSTDALAGKFSTLDNEVKEFLSLIRNKVA